MIAIALDCGLRKRSKCGYLKEGVCHFYFHTWSSREEIPQGAGEPVQTEKPKSGWHVKPTTLFCALCPMSPELEVVGDRLIGIEAQVLTNPLSGIWSDFECECGATELIAAAVKCTECGLETWWGWGPEK